MVSRSRIMVAILVAAFLGLSGGLSREQSAALATEASAEALEIKARPIADFDRADASRIRFGRLEFRGGLVLSSNSEEFGALSGLVMAPDGRRFLAVSDAGRWVSGEITYDGQRPGGITGARTGPLLAKSGRRLEGKRNYDAEDVTLLSGDLDRGMVLISFERLHRIGKFPIRDGIVQAPVGYLALPPDAARMKSNSGIEALGVIRDGSGNDTIIAFAERLLDERGNHTGWLWDGRGPQAFHVTDVDEFSITSVAQLEQRGLLILERRFRWSDGVKMRLRYLPSAVIVAGATAQGEVLLEADMNYEIDNMEGLAVHKGPAGETVVTLLSDDNLNRFLQRTILLQFTLTTSGLADARAR